MNKDSETTTTGRSFIEINSIQKHLKTKKDEANTKHRKLDRLCAKFRGGFLTPPEKLIISKNCSYWT